MVMVILVVALGTAASAGFRFLAGFQFLAQAC